MGLKYLHESHSHTGVDVVLFQFSVLMKGLGVDTPLVLPGNHRAKGRNPYCPTMQVQSETPALRDTAFLLKRSVG